MTNHVPRPRIGWGRFGWWRALLIGTGQGIAILPGVSRSGTTIALALLAGVKRKWAGEFSFFIAAPAICGATLLHAREMMASANDAAGELPIGPLFVGTLFATMTGYAALLVLLVVVRRAKLHYFSYYCWVAGIVVLLVLRNGP
jgi:undecaprenyl-diphosphatase